MKKIPSKYKNIVFSMILSALMSFIITTVNLLKHMNLHEVLPVLVGYWIASYTVSLPTVLLVSPFVRRFVNKICH